MRIPGASDAYLYHHINTILPIFVAELMHLNEFADLPLVLPSHQRKPEQQMPRLPHYIPRKDS
jgi:hypothetical protein